jgi:hypothetical protein
MHPLVHLGLPIPWGDRALSTRRDVFGRDAGNGRWRAIKSTSAGPNAKISTNPNPSATRRQPVTRLRAPVKFAACSSSSAGASAAPVPASACQTSGRLSAVIASRICRSPSCRVTTIQSRLTIRDGARLSAMDESRPVNAYSRSAWGAETMKASAPTVSRFGPRRGIHTPRVPPNPPVPRTLAPLRGARKDTCASISPRSGAFPSRSRFRRTKRYTITHGIARVTTNSITTGTSFATLSVSGLIQCYSA